jgi:hypothetical protein
MATSSYPLSQPTPAQLYFHNLGRAARYFGAALVAAAPTPPESGPVAAPGTVKLLDQYDNPVESDGRAAETLYALAREFEPTQPNQAAELRWLASHG